MSPRLDGAREASLVAGSLSRHSSFRRAVCVDAHVRICAGGAQRWASLPRHFRRSDDRRKWQRRSPGGNFGIADHPTGTQKTQIIWAQ